MDYHNITTDDMRNGDGLRTVLWVAGCNHHCKGCQNPVTWNPHDGLIFDVEAEQELYNKVNKSHISGVTFSGGDPLYPENRDAIFHLAKYIKKYMPGKTVWLYTGYLWEDVRDLPRVQKRRFSSKGGARTFWESGFSKPVKKSIKDVKRVTLASSDLPRRETTRGTIAYRKNRELGKPSTHD